MMRTIYSPLRADFLMWCYCRLNPHPNVENLQEEIEEFIVLGVIKKDESQRNVYEMTPLGRAWVQAMLNTPIPTAAFVDEQGRVIDCR